jgi:hypothetical protein
MGLRLNIEEIARIGVWKFHLYDNVMEALFERFMNIIKEFKRK